MSYERHDTNHNAQSLLLLTHPELTELAISLNVEFMKPDGDAIPTSEVLRRVNHILSWYHDIEVKLIQ